MVAVVRRLRGVVRRSDDGFSLLEVVVALGLLAVVITPASLLFIKSMQSSKLDEQRQAAAMIADETLEMVRAHDPTKLLDGRNATDITNQWNNPGPISLAQSNKPTGGDPTGTAFIPATPQYTTIAGVKYTVNTILGFCYAPTGSAAVNTTSTTCDKTNLAGTSLMYRVSVSVSWSAGHGYSCSGNGGLCSAVADTLIDPALGDPLFNNNA